MTQTETLKLALKALKTPRPFDNYPPLWQAYEKTINEAITSIEETLAQPEQEPVAWRAPNWGHGDDEWVYRDFDDPVLIADGKPSPNNEALYTTPSHCKPLTDEQLDKAGMKLAECMYYPWEHMPEEGKRNMRDYAKAIIEAAHGIKELV